MAASRPPSRSSPSLASTMTLSLRPLSTNMSSAFSRPEAREVPGVGTMPGSMVSRNRPTASASRVRGTSGYASPSTATSANRLPPRRSRSQESAAFATKSRLGCTSSAPMEADVSAISTTSTPSRSIFSRTSPQRGWASATITHAAPARRSPSRTKRHASCGLRRTRPHSARETRRAVWSRSERTPHHSPAASSGSSRSAKSHDGCASSMSLPHAGATRKPVAQAADAARSSAAAVVRYGRKSSR